MYYQLLFIFLLLAIGAASNIKISCQPCSCDSNTCNIYDGGPFNNNPICGQCDSGSVTTIDIGCTCSLGCGYTFSTPGKIVSGCATNSDEYWPYIQLILNSDYRQVGLGNSYNWCGGVCVGPIIGVVIGVLAGAGILTALAIYFRRRQISKQQDLQMITSTQSNY